MAPDCQTINFSQHQSAPRQKGTSPYSSEVLESNVANYDCDEDFVAETTKWAEDEGGG